MKINEICKELDISRQGLYYMLENAELGCHAIKKSNGRWSIDGTGFEMLKDLRKKSRTVLLVEKPADKHTKETMKGMQIEINNLATQLRGEQLRSEQGIFLANSIEELAKESKELDISIKRQLLRLVKAFRSETSERGIKKRLRAEKKVNEPLLESLGQTKLFE